MNRRLLNLFAEDGRSLTLALDGPAFSSNTAGVDAAAAQVSAMAEVGLDHVLVCHGQARRHPEWFRDVAMSLRCDATTSIYDAAVPGTVLNFDVEDALGLGADGVVLMNFPGARNEAQTWEYTSRLAGQAQRWNMPLIVETLPYGYAVTGPESEDPGHIAAAARTSVESGADVIKTRFSGTDGDTEICESVDVPVLALGGPKTSTADYFRFVEHVMKCGAAGVAVGRNITQDPHPLRLVAALDVLVHDGGSADQALSVYES